MGYSITWDSDNNRWKGYGVPCTCEHPECSTAVDRGMGCLCEGCGLAFCGEHLHITAFCERCLEINDVGEYPDGIRPFTAKPEHPEWLTHLRTDPSWAKWREGNISLIEAWEQVSLQAQTQKGACDGM